MVICWWRRVITRYRSVQVISPFVHEVSYPSGVALTHVGWRPVLDGGGVLLSCRWSVQDSTPRKPPHQHALTRFITDTPPARAGVSQSTRVNMSEPPVEVSRNVEHRTDFRGNDAFPRNNNSNTRQACWAALGWESVECSRTEHRLRFRHTSGSSRHPRLPQRTAGSSSSDSRSTRSSRRAGSSSQVS